MKNIVAILGCVAHIGATRSGRLVNTTSGPVQGHASALNPQIDEFLGIPFAKPPIGALRFQVPQRFEGNGSTFHADKLVSFASELFSTECVSA